jgi:hypothetical protein
MECDCTYIKKEIGKEKLEFFLFRGGVYLGPVVNASRVHIVPGCHVGSSFSQGASV